MPRLAGLQSLYMENQLRAYIERRRTNAIMANVAKVLSPPMISALAAYFINLDPKPIGGTPSGSLALGKQIFMDEFPTPMCLHARPVMAARARGRMRFRG
jgi:cytochrome c553